MDTQNAFKQSRFAYWKDRGIHLGLLLLLGIPVVSWTQNTGNFVPYLHYYTPYGQELYVLCKLVGLNAYVFLWLQLTYGLLGKMQHPSPFKLDFHRLLGGMSVILISLHGALFVGAVSFRSQRLVLDFLVPTFSKGYYATMVSLGVISLAVLLIALFCAVTRWIWPRLWKLGHWLATPAFILVCIHSWSIGSESRLPAMIGIYVVTLTMLIILILTRLRMSRKMTSLCCASSEA